MRASWSTVDPTTGRCRGCVATVGKVHVTPGGVNAIPSHVTGWLDARGPDEAQVEGLVRDLTARCGGEPGGATVTQESWTPTTRFDGPLTERLRGVLQRADRAAGRGDASSPELSVPVLGTGAGHDAGILATAGIPSAMLFVRNPSGVSHSPAEHAEAADCHAGADALAACLAELAQDPS